jgi:predicted DCC family thiol-disulfide oxidoreductase YuxK
MALDALTGTEMQEIASSVRGMGQRIIVFDAECVLCSANAQFVLRRDRTGAFLLASMQGDVGAGLYRKFGIDPANPETLIVVDGEMALRDSDAVLAIYAGLGWPWRALATLRFNPRALRDGAYLFLARHRYRVFGRRETCWTPTPEQASRVL